VLDVGFGDNEFLMNLKEKGHAGVLVGVDNEHLVREAKFKGSDSFGIDLRPGDACNLDFDDDSFDMVTAFFMLYHTDVDKALDEMHRVIKPGGKLVAATSSDLNKRNQRIFEKIIAAELGIEPPPPFNERFNSSDALEILERYFNKPEILVDQFGHIPIDNDKKLIEYIDSIVSMKQAFQPMPSFTELTEAIEKTVLPIIQKQIDKKGAFNEFMHRTVYVCGKL